MANLVSFCSLTSGPNENILHVIEEEIESEIHIGAIILLLCISDMSHRILITNVFFFDQLQTIQLTFPCEVIWAITALSEQCFASKS